jgi:hypothetical protein
VQCAPSQDMKNIPVRFCHIRGVRLLCSGIFAVRIQEIKGMNLFAKLNCANLLIMQNYLKMEYIGELKQF